MFVLVLLCMKNETESGVIRYKESSDGFLPAEMKWSVMSNALALEYRPTDSKVSTCNDDFHPANSSL